MSEDLDTLFGRLGKLVPGYAGYADCERRRASDQALRLATAAQLGRARAALDRRSAGRARKRRLDALDPVDVLSRRVANVADRVRYSPVGYTALFDAAAIGEADLGRLYALDFDVQRACERVVYEAEHLPAGADAAALQKTIAAASGVEAALDRRTAALREAAAPARAGAAA